MNISGRTNIYTCGDDSPLPLASFLALIASEDRDSGGKMSRPHATHIITLHHGALPQSEFNKKVAKNVLNEGDFMTIMEI